MKKQKVLFILHLPPPIHGASIMGKYIYDSVLLNKNFECKFINLSASKDVTAIGKLKVSKLLFLIRNFFEIIIAISKSKPDLCYVSPSSWDWGFYRDFLLVSILKTFRIKVIAHFHNKGVQVWNEKKINIYLQRLFYKNIKVILLSKELVEEKKKYISPEDLFICPNGIEQSIKTDVKLPNDIFTFLFISNMMEEKGVFILLEACKILYNKGFNFKCNFVGKWADVSEERFNSFVYQNKLTDNIFAYGPKYNEDKRYYLETADVFVFPTYYHGETFGLVLLEAMDFGLPCISTFEGGIPSVIEDGKTGFLVNQKNIDELAEKMIYCINNPEKCLEMGIEAKKRFDNNFALKHFEENLSNILKKCI